MYKSFFGFRERPFKLVPDPDYLYLSSTHEEAMAHLVYAIAQGEGFVEITGEVGTGKTTLCRAFLEKLDEKTEAAYIFNPKMDSLQLVKSINDEFGIRSDADNIKGLIDVLNVFLMEKRAQGKDVVLIIDEAQDLNREVLEQLRLLSNLETTKNKLLQIILVGQPELRENLNSRELRQLRQRITLSCHLSPLTLRETAEYIRYRIRKASLTKEIEFTPGALRSIYKHSRGIPRLINITCDRALINAFSLNQKKINRNVTRKAIRELKGRGFALQIGDRTVWIFAILSIFLVVYIFYPSIKPVEHIIAENNQTQALNISSPMPEESEKTLLPVSDQHQGQAEEKIDTEPDHAMTFRYDLGNILQEVIHFPSREIAFQNTLNLWDIGPAVIDYLSPVEDDFAFFRLAAQKNGLMLYRIEGDLERIKDLNLPAIFRFYAPERQTPVYFTLMKIIGQDLQFKGKDESEVIVVDEEELMKFWSGAAFILWKNAFVFTGTIPVDSPGDSIITLKLLLKDIGFEEIEINPQYDGKTQEAVKRIQAKHGIPVDGVVGSMTKIALHNEKKSLKIPHLY
ncbi:AAA family ATPase [Thermodesulfobacteriota bacterium]